MSSKPVRLPVVSNERMYASFMRHISTVEPEAPEPIDPMDRCVRDAVATLAEIMDQLVRAEVDIIGHLPEQVRLKLSRMILTTAEKAEATHTALVSYAKHGTLTPPRFGKHGHGAVNRRKRLKP